MKIYNNRKALPVFRRLCAIAMIMFIAGCDTPSAPVNSDIQPRDGSPVQRVRISAITEFVPGPDWAQIKTLVQLLDGIGTPVKVPCVFRFEFYEFHSVSSDPRGKRLIIWPDWKLTEADTVEEHWKDFLRGYEFFLPIEFSSEPDKKYILEVTCLVGQQRYSDLFKMQFQP